MTAPGRSKGEATRQHVFDTALKLFRRRGVERTTMRDIADAAELSLGAAYHYFESKDALVEAYYEWMQAEHERRTADGCPREASLEARLHGLLVTKLELLRRDRKLLAALFANLGDASHPLSVFSRRTAPTRERSIAQFVALFDHEPLPVELRELLGRAIWLAHLGVFLFFVHDGSALQIRTQKLIALLVEATSKGTPLLAHPLAEPIRRRLLELSADLSVERLGAR